MAKKNRVDPYKRIPNVNFTVDIDDTKARRKYKMQRLERGFDDTETWNLDYTLAKFLAPRLRRFIEVHTGVPAWFISNEKTQEESRQEWLDILNEILWCCEHYDTYEYEDNFFDKSREEQNAIEERFTKGFELLGKYWKCLWW